MAKKVKIVHPRTSMEEHWSTDRLEAYERTYGPVERASKRAKKPRDEPKARSPKN